MRLNRILIIIVLTLTSFACGQKGALMLDQPAKKELKSESRVKQSSMAPVEAVPVKKKSKE